MSQVRKLPKLKKMELAHSAMRPPSGDFVAVGSLPDGTVVWEGPVFKGNPFFRDHEAEAKGAPVDTGHEREPVMDPIRRDEDGKPVQLWKRNKATGEAITPVFKNKRGHKIVRGIMVDMGNGRAELRPVPVHAEEIKQRKQAEAAAAEFQKAFMREAAERGVNAGELLDALVATKKGKKEA